MKRSKEDIIIELLEQAKNAANEIEHEMVLSEAHHLLKKHHESVFTDMWHFFDEEVERAPSGELQVKKREEQYEERQ